MSRPRHEAAAPAPVARCDRADLTARGTALPALLHPTGFPAEKSRTATRCTHTTSSLTAGCPNGEVVSLHRPPALRSVRRCSGCPKHRRRAPGHRLLELRDRAEPPGCPNDPFAAPLRRSVPRGVVSKAVSRSATSSPRHGCPCWRHSTSHGCPCEAFPRHRVTSMTSGLRCDPLTFWLPRDESVANSESVLRSPA